MPFKIPMSHKTSFWIKQKKKKKDGTTYIIRILNPFLQWLGRSSHFFNKMVLELLMSFLCLCGLSPFSEFLQKHASRCTWCAKFSQEWICVHVCMGSIRDVSLVILLPGVSGIASRSTPTLSSYELLKLNEWISQINWKPFIRLAFKATFLILMKRN